MNEKEIEADLNDSGMRISGKLLPAIWDKTLGRTVGSRTPRFRSLFDPLCWLSTNFETTRVVWFAAPVSGRAANMQPWYLWTKSHWVRFLNLWVRNTSHGARSWWNYLSGDLVAPGILQKQASPLRAVRTMSNSLWFRCSAKVSSFCRGID
jgi:hypothetical protein